MVDKTLTREMIAAGKRLLEVLDEEGINPAAALWFYYPEYERWKLLIAEYEVGSTGPMNLYRQIREVLEAKRDELPDLQLFDVVLVKPDEPLLRLLRQAIGTDTSVSGIRFKNNVVNGTVIEDTYLYRLT